MMEYHKMSFTEAVRSLAARVGMVIPEEEHSEEERSEYSRYDTAYALLRAAANYYYKQLMGAQGVSAREYLARRGFQDTTVKEFGLGYSLDEWQGLLDDMKQQGFTDEAFEDAGLAIARDSGGMYDRFRGRLMFPIQNAMGRVVGFGARLLDAQAKQAKYVNSPQSLVYDKSKVLYGIFQAKDAIRRADKALLVEGYADLLSLYQAGFHNVVASSGTALTKEQLHLVGRYSKNLCIVYDGDSAGANAAVRGLELAVEEGFDVKVVRLPDGDDPDTFVQARGADAMQKLLDDAISFVDFKGEMLKAQGLLETPEGQAKVVHSLVETIAKVPDHIKRDFMIRAVALRFELNEHLLYGELSRILRKRELVLRTSAMPQAEQREPIEQEPQRKPQADGTGAPVTAIVAKGEGGKEEKESHSKPIDELLAEERELLRIMLEEPKSIAYMRQKFGVDAHTFISSMGQKLCTLVFEVAESYRNIGQALLNKLIEEGREEERVYSMILSDILLRREVPSERWREFGVSLHEEPLKVIADCLAQLRIKQNSAALDAIEMQLKTCDPEQGMELLQEYMRIRSEVDRIRTQGLESS